MTSFLRSAWAEILSPIFKRPPLFQVAALCHRGTGKDLEVLLITSSSGNWILPKGWPIMGLDAPDTALREAWEEAGVKSGKPRRKPFASIDTTKRFDSGAVVPCQLDIYDIAVGKLGDDYPEAGQRSREWVTPKDAATMLADAEVARVVTEFGNTHA